MYPNAKNMVVVPNHKSNGDYYENLSLSHFMDGLYKENGGKKSFSCQTKHQYHVSQWGEHDCSA